jgi:hypothetical protein
MYSIENVSDFRMKNYSFSDVLKFVYINQEEKHSKPIDV